MYLIPRASAAWPLAGPLHFLFHQLLFLLVAVPRFGAAKAAKSWCWHPPFRWPFVSFEVRGVQSFTDTMFGVVHMLRPFWTFNKDFSRMFIKLWTIEINFQSLICKDFCRFLWKFSDRFLDLLMDFPGWSPQVQHTSMVWPSIPHWGDLHQRAVTQARRWQQIDRMITLYEIIEGSLEVKLLTTWTDEKAEVGRVREERSRRKKIREEKESEERRCRWTKR